MIQQTNTTSSVTREYYSLRASKAREMAERASSAYIAAIHLELADRYEFIARSVVEKDTIEIFEI